MRPQERKNSRSKFKCAFISSTGTQALENTGVKFKLSSPRPKAFRTMYVSHHHIISIYLQFLAEPQNLKPFTCERMKGIVLSQDPFITPTQSIGLQHSELRGAPRSPCGFFFVLFPLSHPAPRLARVLLHCLNEK